ncbi:MAG: hypothetical protein JXQ96_13545 [Cyclobacteriaceae bacterium]
MKSIRRSWFFRIFAFLMIGAVSFYSIMFLIPGIGPNQWVLRSIGWGIPYGSMVILNLAQGFVVIFLATGLMKRNKKLDTNEVFLARPLSNAEYVLGRVWTLLKLFFGIHVILTIEVLIINLSISDAPLQPLAYLVYPLLMSIPNLLFMIGLSFFMVGLLRNQAISLILLLGIAGSSLVYLSTEYYFLFDYSAFRLPMLFSDMLGFHDAEFILMQRGFFATLGIAFISLTILLFDRLPRGKSGPMLAALFAIVLFSTAGIIAYQYLQTTIWKPDAIRAQTIELNNEFGAKKNVTIKSCDLQVDHNNGVACRATLVVKNENLGPLENWFVCLNPSLQVNSIKLDGKEVVFNRKLHIIEIDSNDKLNANETLKVEIDYSGRIDESVAYLQVEEETRKEINQRWLYQLPKRHSFLTPNYVVLTPEIQWYPVTFPGYMSSNQLLNPVEFADYSLEVNTKNNLTAISQGELVESGDGNFKFRSQQALPQISLVIGDYEKKEIEVDSISYELYNFKGHDFYSEYFTDLTDTIPDLIRESKESFEEKMGLNYPYHKLSFVETPVQFYAYRTLEASDMAYVQPEMIFWTEKGGRAYDINFKRAFRDIDRRTRNQRLTKKQKQYQAMKAIVDRMLVPVDTDGDLSNPRYRSIITNYYGFTNSLQSKKWPYLDKIITSYLKPRKAKSPNDRYWSNLSVAERANRAILGSNVKEFLESEEETRLKDEIILSRGAMLFTILEKRVGQNEFGEFLRNFLVQNRFKNTSFEDFNSAFKQEFDLDFEQLLKQIYENADPPSYDISKPELYEVNSDGYSRYQTSINICNSSQANGAVVIKYAEKSDFNGSNARTDIITLLPGEVKKISAVLEYEPAISINTIASQNLPMILGYKAKSLDVKNAKSAYDGEQVIENGMSDLNTIIVDNEDEGFSLISNQQETLLDKLTNFEEEEEDEYLPIWRTYRKNNWVKSVDSKFYGRHIRSVHVTRAGEGKREAIWEAEVQNVGYYDIYAYINENPDGFSRRRGNNNKPKMEDIYTVHHEDGEEQVLIDVRKSGHGWVLLGSFRLQPGLAMVKLSDKREEDRGYVFADAIKWVRQ